MGEGEAAASYASGLTRLFWQSTAQTCRMPPLTQPMHLYSSGQTKGGPRSAL